jgi:hypothetical protein
MFGGNRKIVWHSLIVWHAILLQYHWHVFRSKFCPFKQICALKVYVFVKHDFELFFKVKSYRNVFCGLEISEKCDKKYNFKLIEK